MRHDLIDKYDLRLPRYTSYPTSPHFSADIGPETHANWLAELDPSEPISLYAHIAYCAEMCWFCGCHTKITRQYAPIADYLDAMLSEIDLIADRLAVPLPVAHLHFGGGTPTSLTPEDFERLVGAFKARFRFLPDAEIAVEVDPRTTNREYVAAMARAGVNRCSMGVQDFNPKVQAAINRIQPYEVTAQVFAWLREEGIEAINMDLVYGLPHQTVDGMIETVDRAMTLAPKRIALFGYAHVPWMKKHQRLIPEDALPGIEERWAQYTAVQDRLAAHGYKAIGLDHFATADDDMVAALEAGELKRNFQGYTTDDADTLLAFGASGISALPQGYLANETEIHRYKDLIRNDRLATRRGYAISQDDILRRAVIERLMCDMAVDLDSVARQHGRSGQSFAEEIARLAPLEADGVIERAGTHIRVTDDGRPLVRVVCAVFDRYLKAGETRHSRAV